MLEVFFRSLGTFVPRAEVLLFGCARANERMTAPRAGDEEQPIRDTLLNTSELIGCGGIVSATPPSMQSLRCRLPDALPDARVFFYLADDGSVRRW